MKPIFSLISIFLFSISLSTICLSKPIIGIFGDVHSNEEGMVLALNQMKERGVTHIIGTGDFVGRAKPEELDSLLARVSEVTGVTKGNTFLIPGNWEHEAWITPEVSNSILSQYGRLVFERYDGYGIVQIEETKIMLSHFPQHPIPAHYVPPKSFLKRSTKKKYDENGNVIEPPHGEEVKMQAFILDTMKNNIYPERGVEFSIFAHSHIRASYVDPISKRLVINAGVIDPERKAPTEKRAFAIYSGKTKDIVFYNVDTGDIITTENTNNRTVTQETIVGLEGCRNLQELFGAL